MKLTAMVLVLALAACCSAGPMTIKYTIENDLVGDPFTYSLDLDVSDNQKFSAMMQQAAAQDSHFAFTKTQWPQLGFFIDSINGLSDDFPNEMFWALLMRDANGDCLSPVGVSSLYIDDGDHVVFSYSTYNIFNVLPNCDFCLPHA